MPTTTINLTGQALSKVDDTNVTLTLGGTPLTALLKATSLTLGWSGQLSVARGGTGLSSLGTASQLIRVNGAGTALEYFTPTYGSGTVTTVSVVSANGFAGTVANAGTTPAITLSTTITGLLKGNGTAISAASAGTDYEVPLTFSTGLTRTVNTITIDSTVVTLTGAQALSNKTGLISQWTNDAGYLTSLSGAVTSVSGTTNRITSSGGATPVIDISASYVGQTSITTLGTIGTGTWQGTAIGKAYGGTGVNIGSAALVLGTASTTAGQLTLSNATNAFTQTFRGTNPSASITYDLPTTAPTAGQVLQSTAPSAGVATLSWATASSGITVGTTTITSGTSGRIPYNSSGVYQEATKDLYFETASPYAHVFAGGRTGTITGIDNTAVGYYAGKVLTSGTDNTLTGYIAGQSITSGSYNTNIGSYSNWQNSTSNNNTTVGYYAGYWATSSGNTLIGRSAGQSVSTGAENTAVGYQSLSQQGGVSYTTALGSWAGASSRNSSYNIFLGAYADEPNANANINSSIAIGYAAKILSAHQGVLGSNDANGYIDNWYLNGITHTAPYSVTLNACGGSGTNVAGASLTFSGGKATGSAAGGALVFKTSTTLGSGTTLQSLVSRLTISGGAVTTDASTATWADALDFVFGTTTGTKFGTATTQKLAFWNATPIVQPTTAVGSATLTSPGGGTQIKTDDTFDGYTLQQVVKALRNLGLLT